MVYDSARYSTTLLLCYVQAQWRYHIAGGHQPGRSAIHGRVGRGTGDILRSPTNNGIKPMGAEIPMCFFLTDLACGSKTDIYFHLYYVIHVHRHVLLCKREAPKILLKDGAPISAGSVKTLTVQGSMQTDVQSSIQS